MSYSAAPARQRLVLVQWPAAAHLDAVGLPHAPLPVLALRAPPGEVETRARGWVAATAGGVKLCLAAKQLVKLPYSRIQTVLYAPLAPVVDQAPGHLLLNAAELPAQQLDKIFQLQRAASCRVYQNVDLQCQSQVGLQQQAPGAAG